MNLDHVAIQVHDIQEAVNWYTEQLQAKIKYADQTWALMEIGTTRVALTLPGSHPPHIAFRVFSMEEFPEGEIKEHRDGSKYLYKEDCSGNVIEYIFWPQS